jgi:hypothetical protein
LEVVGWVEPVPESVEVQGEIQQYLRSGRIQWEGLFETILLRLMDFMFRLNPKSATEMINRQMASLLK